MLFAVVCKKLSEISLKLWTIHVKENHTRSDDLTYFSIFTVLSILYVIPVAFRIYILMIGNSNLAKQLHFDMITRILKAPITLYHEVTSSGLILNRFTKDLSMLLRSMYLLGNLSLHISNFFGAGIITIYSFWPSFFILPFIFCTSFYIVKYWMLTGRELKRVETKTKTPIINLLSESAEGASLIRCMGYSEYYRNQTEAKLTINVQAKVFNNGLNTFFEFLVDSVVLVSLTVILLLVYFFGEQIGSQNIGLMLSEVILLPSYLSMIVGEMTSFQIEQVSFERCLELTEIIQEVESEERSNFLEFPNGEVEISNLFVKYREGLDFALKDVSLHIRPREKVGVCGRTGSGKSTICLSLFRIIEAHQGQITIDGYNISAIPLAKLRQNITIIPQDPFLFKGTLRYNVDPLGKLTDDRIKEVFDLIKCSYLYENELGLDFLIEEGGDNMSVGEKQLICIARAISRKSKIVVMDEATASIDDKSEKIIQLAFKEALKECTVITVAHRIKTILDFDK